MATQEKSISQKNVSDLIEAINSVNIESVVKRESHISQLQAWCNEPICFEDKIAHEMAKNILQLIQPEK